MIRPDPPRRTCRREEASTGLALKSASPMKILLYNPDNGVTQNFMPHLWMFLLQSLTPKGHEVVLIDGNTQPMTDAELVKFVLREKIGLVGIGAMTRMIAKAYRVADAVRAAGIPVVMGGPHITEVPDEALGRDGGPRHADCLALGEADETWPRIVEDAARGQLKEVYAPVDAFGQDHKPSLQDYPAIPWDSLDIRQFNRIPGFFRPVLRHFGYAWETFHIIPIESGRGCPYGCEFCTVTGFFGDSIRFRTNRSIVDEMLKLKERARGSSGSNFTIGMHHAAVANRRKNGGKSQVEIQHSGSEIAFCEGNCLTRAEFNFVEYAAVFPKRDFAFCTTLEVIENDFRKASKGHLTQISDVDDSGREKRGGSRTHSLSFAYKWLGRKDGFQG